LGGRRATRRAEKQNAQKTNSVLDLRDLSKNHEVKEKLEGKRRRSSSRGQKTDKITARDKFPNTDL